MRKPVTETNLDGLQLLKRGKVRDLYEVPEGLLIVATDRLSAFDVVFGEGIPGKGVILTQLTAFWFDLLSDVVTNHLITTDVSEMPEAVRRHEEILRGRTMLVRRADVLPVECIARGYLAGSGWKDYGRTGSVCGIALPEGLELSSKLPEPIFTPSTKADVGHDENITYDQTIEIIGTERAEELKVTTLALYQAGLEHAASRGILLCDTKFEFGTTPDGELMLIDEALTPDSSRFWDRDTYTEGVAQDSYDKQIVRDYLMTLDWDKSPPPPALPPEVVEKTADRYRKIAEKIAGKSLEVEA